MSVAVQCPGFNCPIFLTGPSGEMFYQDAQKTFISSLQKGFIDFWRSESNTFGRPLVEAATSLRETFEECSVPDWDGYNALPINEDAFNEANKIIELLPSSIPMPEIMADPNGEIAFEWRKGNNHIFVLSVSGRQKITYAGIFGSNKTHGVEYYNSSLPSIILDYIRRVYA
jgi:hypothetical protein